jgi:hypothetical protein
VALQRAAGLECRADYFRNLKLIDWRLAPPLRNDFELELQEPEPAAFAKLCAYWDLSGADQACRGFSSPGKLAPSPATECRATKYCCGIWRDEGDSCTFIGAAIK